MAGEVTVNRAAMVTAAQQVEGALGEIRAQQTRLNGIHDTLSGSWKGEASAAFTNAYMQFSTDFTIVVNALNGIHERLVGRHANYTATAPANTQTLYKVLAPPTRQRR